MMPRASSVKQELSPPYSVKPAIDGQQLSASLSNRARPPDPQKRTAAPGVGARDGGKAEEAIKQLHRGQYVPIIRSSSAVVVVRPDSLVVAVAASVAEARAFLRGAA